MLENVQKHILVLRAFKGPKGHGIMREPLEMATVPLMQNMVQILKKSTYFVTRNSCLDLGKIFLVLSTLKAPTVGPFLQKFALRGCGDNSEWLWLNLCEALL